MGFCVKPEYRWPQGIIPFEFERAVSSDVRQVIDRAMVRWQKKVNAGGRTYIRFKLRTNEVPFVCISTSPEGSTKAGSIGTFDMTNAGVNAKFNIVANDAGIGAIPHELGHTIGLAHEHERPDSNLIPDPKGLRHFLIIESQKLTHARYVMHGKYDPASMLHYVAPPGYIWKPGTSGGTQPTAAEVRIDAWTPSAGDIATVRALYTGELTGPVVSLTQPFDVEPVNLFKDV